MIGCGPDCRLTCKQEVVTAICINTYHLLQSRNLCLLLTSAFMLRFRLLCLPLSNCTAVFYTSRAAYASSDESLFPTIPNGSRHFVLTVHTDNVASEYQRETDFRKASNIERSSCLLLCGICCSKWDEAYPQHTLSDEP